MSKFSKKNKKSTKRYKNYRNQPNGPFSKGDGKAYEKKRVYPLHHHIELGRRKAMASDSTNEFVYRCDIKGMLKNEHKFEAKDIVNNSASSFMDPKRTYTFMLKGFSTLTCSASGILDVFLPFDPSSTGYNFAEWTDVAGLFSEFRLIMFKVQFTGVKNTAGSFVYPPVAIGSNLSYSAIASSQGAVIQQADGRFWTAVGDSSPLGIIHRVVPGPRLGWSSVSTPVNAPYAGSPGCIQIYGTGQGVSNQVGYATVMGIYEFRVRS